MMLMILFACTVYTYATYSARESDVHRFSSGASLIYSRIVSCHSFLCAQSPTRIHWLPKAFNCQISFMICRDRIFYAFNTIQTVQSCPKTNWKKTRMCNGARKESTLHFSVKLVNMLPPHTTLNLLMIKPHRDTLTRMHSPSSDWVHCT